MDLVAQNKDEPIPTQIEVAYQAFHSALESRAADIQQTPRKTFKYGATDRHQLDVYYPTSSASGKAPVLVFVYGGGYHSGARQMPPPRQMVYSNVGAFFAQRGFVTVIPDYRILPDMKFPDPLVDVKDAISFLVDNPSQINADATVHGDVDEIVVMGHSAGASITISAFLVPGLIPTSVKSHVRGLILKGGVFHSHTASVALPPPIMLAYYGSEEGVKENEPLALLQKASAEVVQSLPEVHTFVSEYDLGAMLESTADLRKLLQERTGKEVGESVMKGHSHISPHICLFTGQGEEWAEEVVAWVKARVRK